MYLYYFTNHDDEAKSILGNYAREWISKNYDYDAELKIEWCNRNDVMLKI